MNKAFIGVDPGLKGGLAIISENKGVFVTPMLLSGNEIDILSTIKWICKGIDDRITVCAIELVHSMTKQGVASSFKFGLVTGEIRGMIKSMEIPMYSISPQAWKKVVLVDTDKSKEAAIAFCRNVYPEVSLFATPKSTTPHTGIADALCIAHYAKLKFKGE